MLNQVAATTALGKRDPLPIPQAGRNVLKRVVLNQEKRAFQANAVEAVRIGAEHTSHFGNQFAVVAFLHPVEKHSLRAVANFNRVEVTVQLSNRQFVTVDVVEATRLFRSFSLVKVRRHENASPGAHTLCDLLKRLNESTLSRLSVENRFVLEVIGYQRLDAFRRRCIGKQRQAVKEIWANLALLVSQAVADPCCVYGYR